MPCEMELLPALLCSSELSEVCCEVVFSCPMLQGFVVVVFVF